MDRATTGLGLEGQAALPPNFDPRIPGPLARPVAIALLEQADELLEADEPGQALARYARVIGSPDRDVTAAAFYGSGNALYRLDRDAEALHAWEQAAELGETPVTYRAWRQVAAARVRAGNLQGAVDAYHQAERRAPREDRAEIASRLGWLSKETGNRRAAGRYFARSRGDAAPPFLTYLIIGVTVITSLAAQSGPVNRTGFTSLETLLMLNKPLVATGEYYRLLSVTLVHDPTNILHLLFNMYALWYAGVLVERMYGPLLLGLFYVLCGVAASVASFVFGDGPLAVGASGAIFGLFGIILVATRVHHPVLDAQSRAIASQIGILIVINLVIGFSGALNVDNSAHVGGLLAGIWLGFVLPPGRVPTLSAMWQRPGGAGAPFEAIVLRIVAVFALVVVIGAGIVVGTGTWGPG